MWAPVFISEQCVKREQQSTKSKSKCTVSNVSSSRAGGTGGIVTGKTWGPCWCDTPDMPCKPASRLPLRLLPGCLTWECLQMGLRHIHIFNGPCSYAHKAIVLSSPLRIHTEFMVLGFKWNHIFVFLSTEELEGSVLGVFLEGVLSSNSSHLPPHFGQYLPLSRPCPGFRDGWGTALP